MTKKETIIKAWVDLGIKTPFGICDNTGFYHGYFCNGVDEILEGFDLKIEQIDYDLDFDGIGKFRPKSLQGIENNNGWIKIESAEDLPKEESSYYFIKRKSLNIILSDFNIRYCDKEKCVILYSYYQPITKPKPPIY